MRVELVPPDSDTEPRHWARHDRAFAMMLRPGSIEWGSSVPLWKIASSEESVGSRGGQQGNDVRKRRNLRQVDSNDLCCSSESE
jgi:hypothetical protein